MDRLIQMGKEVMRGRICKISLSSSKMRKGWKEKRKGVKKIKIRKPKGIRSQRKRKMGKLSRLRSMQIGK